MATTKKTPRKPPAPRLKTTSLDVRKCPRCARATLVGVCNGLDIRLDPTPLAEVGEIAVAAVGLPTYVVTAARPRPRRQMDRQKPFPADKRTVHTIHRCGTEIDRAISIHVRRESRPKYPPLPPDPDF